MPLRGQYRKNSRCSLNSGVLPDPTQCCLRSGTALFLRYEFCQANNRHDRRKKDSTAWLSPPAPPGPLSRYSGIPFGRRELINITIEMANIREHCSWVHSERKRRCHTKSKGHHPDVGSPNRRLEPLQEFDLPVNKAALVVGGGVAGMTSALSIANQGHEVYLVEKDKELGRNSAKNSLHPGRAGCSGVFERSHNEGVSASLNPCLY